MGLHAGRGMTKKDSISMHDQNLPLDCGIKGKRTPVPETNSDVVMWPGIPPGT